MLFFCHCCDTLKISIKGKIQANLDFKSFFFYKKNMQTIHFVRMSLHNGRVLKILSLSGQKFAMNAGQASD